MNAGHEAPAFYKRYVEDICRTVETNAQNEFNYIFDEVKRSGAYSSDVTNKLSGAMNDLNDIVNSSDLFDDNHLRSAVLRAALPASLLDLVGLDQILERVPVAYQRAIFSMHLSSRFYYQHGATADPLKFYQFMKKYASQ